MGKNRRRRYTVVLPKRGFLGLRDKHFGDTGTRRGAVSIRQELRKRGVKDAYVKKTA